MTCFTGHYILHYWSWTAASKRLAVSFEIVIFQDIIGPIPSQWLAKELLWWWACRSSSASRFGQWMFLFYCRKCRPRIDSSPEIIPRGSWHRDGVPPAPCCTKSTYLHYHYQEQRHRSTSHSFIHMSQRNSNVRVWLDAWLSRNNTRKFTRY